MILLQVICSEKSPYDIPKVKTIQILLHKKALFKGINDRIFCHNTAYSPNDAITPQKNKIYCIDKNEVCDANFENTPVPE